MTSNTERGRLFQAKCREALQLHFGKHFLPEVKVQIGENKWHSFDLVTEAKDVIVECKAFAFTASGNNPSAKVTTLREAVQYLRAAPGSPIRLLILKRDVHPKRGESLAEYFVRLNSYLLGDVTVVEMEETGGPIRCLHGTIEDWKETARRKLTTLEVGTVTSDDLGRIRRQLIRLLDHLEGGPSTQREGVGERVSRLREKSLVPPNIANWMHSILRMRNESEYKGTTLTRNESTAINAAWAEITDWGKTKGWTAK